ncbi:MAG: ATP-binding protein, partial [Deltaproteobacteria bacterium]|nr:ATP-binding protein [Deltaproteobacteria bacterium]
ITELKKLHRQISPAKELSVVGQLAAGIAHEVGNPLTSISSIVQVIQRTTNDTFAIEKLELVKNQINRIARTIRELVDFSRPSNYEIKQTDVNKVLQDAVNIVRYGKKSKDINFILELDEKIPRLTLVQDQIIQVFINLLLNAVDAMEGKPGEIKVKSELYGNHIKIHFIDKGKGIPDEIKNKIFEPFFTTKKVGEGTGLGLWVSYGIVKNFGGDIDFESQPGKGSTFTISLPIS